MAKYQSRPVPTHPHEALTVSCHLVLWNGEGGGGGGGGSIPAKIASQFGGGSTGKVGSKDKVGSKQQTDNAEQEEENLPPTRMDFLKTVLSSTVPLMMPSGSGPAFTNIAKPISEGMSGIYTGADTGLKANKAKMKKIQDADEAAQEEAQDFADETYGIDNEREARRESKTSKVQKRGEAYMKEHPNKPNPVEQTMSTMFETPEVITTPIESLTSQLADLTNTLQSQQGMIAPKTVNHVGRGAGM